MNVTNSDISCFVSVPFGGGVKAEMGLDGWLVIVFKGAPRWPLDPGKGPWASDIGGVAIRA